MPRKAQKRARLTPQERKFVLQEQERWIAALSVDHHHAIRQCVQLELLLARPERVNREAALFTLALKLGLYREKHGLGRTWTPDQLRRRYHNPRQRSATVGSQDLSPSPGVTSDTASA